MRCDWLIVGAGFSGCVLAERLASQANKRVIVVERRGYIGGTAHDAYDEHGILIHTHGPHIFHTNYRHVVDYLSQFTSWRPYHHRVEAMIDGKLVPLPFNLNSLHALFPTRLADSIEAQLVEKHGFGSDVPILELRRSDDPELRVLADYVYEKVFANYNLKHWGLSPEELDPAVTARVPVRISRDNRYFRDVYQGVPAEGYTAMFRRMLDHPNIRLLLQTDYADVRDEIECEKAVFTGPIDEFFDLRFGALPYRSMRFHHANHGVEWLQEVGVVNYPNDHDFIRMTEHKRITGQVAPTTTTTSEYPEAYVQGRNEPYYPIPREDNRTLHRKYLGEANKLDGRVVFAGRLGCYQYYNMDQAVDSALALFDREARS